MAYPHDEAARQKRLAEDATHGVADSEQATGDDREGQGVRPQDTARYPRADEPELATGHSPEFRDRRDTGTGDRDGATPAGTSDADTAGTGTRPRGR